MASKIKINIGRDDDGNDYFLDLTGAPHILIGGTNMSGKTMLLHNIISGLIKDTNAADTEIWFGGIQPLEFLRYERVPHVQCVAASANDHNAMLQRLVELIENRLILMAQCRDENGLCIDNVFEPKMIRHNTENKEITFPNIIVIFDEITQLVPDNNTKKTIRRNLDSLFRNGRQAGVNIILTTHEFMVGALSSHVKANCSVRIAMKVTSKAKSRIFLNVSDAEEKLAGNGEMFINSHYKTINKSSENPEGTKKLIKIQCNFIDKSEITKRINDAVAENEVR